MNYEKSFYQKINTIADWVIRIIMINVLMILTSIPLITLFPSLAAGYKLLYEYKHKNETKLFKTYFLFFKTDFMRKLQIGIILIVVLLIGYFNVTYYVDILRENENLFYQMGYYITFAFLFVALVITLYTLPIVNIYPRLNLTLMMKLAFALSGKYFLRTLVLFVIHLIPFALMLTPLTSLIMVFAGLSLPMILSVLIHEKASLYLISLGEKHD
ncbi:MAG TPA: YesL family protein [Acholeplasmataceae bacterium]|nr:YesL family protein [Acholeplasmataceae bacterium]